MDWKRNGNELSLTSAVGTYSIKKKGGIFVAYLNGAKTSFTGTSVGKVKKQIERTLRAVNLTKAPDIPSEHDFKGNLEEWEDRVFINAKYFRLHRYYGRGQTDYMEMQTFPEALEFAKTELAANRRVLIYAVTDTERFINCVQNRWDHYSQLWEQHHATTPSR